MILPQLAMFTGCGATKSLTSAGNDADDRLLRNTLPNAVQVPGGKTPAAVRLIAASPKVSAGRDTFAIGSVTVTVLTAPSAKPAALLLSVFGPVVVRFGCASLLISKSMLAEPRAFDRSQAR